MFDHIQIIHNASYIVLNLSALIGLSETKEYLNFHQSIDEFLTEHHEDNTSILVESICCESLSIEIMSQTQFMSFYYAIDSAINLIIDCLKALTNFKSIAAKSCVTNCGNLLFHLQFLNKYHFSH